MAKGVVDLHASRRWVLTGTPIVRPYFLLDMASCQLTSRLILRGYVDDLDMNHTIYIILR